MEYLKLFENHNEYEAFASGNAMIKPNVSHCVSENEVHYNPWVRPNLCYRYYSDQNYYLLCDNKGRIMRLYDHDPYYLGWIGDSTKLFHDMSASGSWNVISGAIDKYGLSFESFNITTTMVNNVDCLKDNKFTWEGTDYVFNNGTWTPSLPGGQFIDPNEVIVEK